MSIVEVVHSLSCLAPYLNGIGLVADAVSCASHRHRCANLARKPTAILYKTRFEDYCVTSVSNFALSPIFDTLVNLDVAHV